MNSGLPYFGVGGVGAYGVGAHDVGAPDVGASNAGAHDVGAPVVGAHVVGSHNFGTHGKTPSHGLIPKLESVTVTIFLTVPVPWKCIHFHPHPAFIKLIPFPSRSR